MAVCSECGRSVFLIFEGNVCRDCSKKQKEAAQDHRRHIATALEKQETETDAHETGERTSEDRLSKALSVVVTTETSVDLKVIKRVDLVMATSICPLSMEVDEFKDELFLRLKVAAVRVGANAVIGVSLNMISEVSNSVGSASLSRYRAVAIGTAVVIDNPISNG